MSLATHEMTTDAEVANQPERRARHGEPRSPARRVDQPDPAGSALDDLFDEAEEAVSAGEPVDEVWVELAAEGVARAIADAADENLAMFQARLRRLLAMLRSASAAGNSGARAPRTRPVALQVEALLYVADAGADLSRPRATGRALEPGSQIAQILLFLESDGDVFTDALVERLGVHPTQVSRACRKLTDDGLILRRQFGRKVSWSLTPAGREAAAATRAASEPKAPPSRIAELVEAVTPSQFDAAIRRAAPLIRIISNTTRSSHEAWAATYLRARSARDAIGSKVLRVGNPPDVLVTKDGSGYYVLVEQGRDPVSGPLEQAPARERL